MPQNRRIVSLGRLQKMRDIYRRIKGVGTRTSISKSEFSRRLDTLIHDMAADRRPSWKYGSGGDSARTRILAFLARRITPGDTISYDSRDGHFPTSFGDVIDGCVFFPLHNNRFECDSCAVSYSRREAAAMPRSRFNAERGHFLICMTCRDSNYVLHEGVWMTIEERNRMIGISLFSYHDSPIESLRVKQFGSTPGERLTEPRPNSLRLTGAESSITRRPLPTHLLKTGEPLWLGVELEVQPIRRPDEDMSRARTRAMTFAAKTTGSFAILKHDGSLDPGGFEICSIPGTLQWHRDVWAPFLESARQHMRGFRAGPAAYGMHVHVSRDSLGALAGGRMMAFIHNPYNYAFITHIAGRDSNSYVRYDANTNVRSIMYGHRSHYDAAGPSHGKPTIEVRIFRSNVSQQGFLRNLDFVHALATWCQVAAPTTTGELIVNRFTAWFSHPSVYSQYPALAAWFKTRSRYNTAIKDGRRVEPEMTDA